MEPALETFLTLPALFHTLNFCCLHLTRSYRANKLLMIGMSTMRSNVTERSEHKPFKKLKPYDRPVEETGRLTVVFILIQGPYFT